MFELVFSRMYREQLFLCSRNQWRSPTAAVLFKDNDLYAARSAGTSDSARIKITAGLINWADRIFVMEKRHSCDNSPQLWRTDRRKIDCRS